MIAEDRIARLSSRIKNINTIKHSRLAPRVNAYICSKCGDITYTVDCADGSSQLAIPCQKKSSKLLNMHGTEALVCDGYMLSSFYTVKVGEYDVDDITHEWYAPSLEEYQKLVRNKSETAVNHVTKGGLLLRDRTDHPVFTHGEAFVTKEGEELDEEQTQLLFTGFERLRAAVKLKVQMARGKKEDRDRAMRKKRDKNRADRNRATRHKRRNRH